MGSVTNGRGNTEERKCKTQQKAFTVNKDTWNSKLQIQVKQDCVKLN